MPILNYKKQFAPLVESGDRLYHYTGLRTKACRKLLESTCLFADRIDILRGRTFGAGPLHKPRINPIDPTKVIDIARTGVTFYEIFLDEAEKYFVK